MASIAKAQPARVRNDVRLERHSAIARGQPVLRAAPGDIPYDDTIDAATTAGPLTHESGLLLMIHGMGSDFDQYDDVSFDFAERYNVVVLQVRDRQAGKAGLEIPYDLGKHQAIDCLRAVAWACRRFAVNRDRVMVYGGSGGGQVALLCLCFAPHLFCAGIAAAAITHPTMPGEITQPEWQDGWMRRCIPEGPVPPEEIDVRSPLRLCANIRAPLVLLHGDHDAVVSAQHSERLARALAQRGSSCAYHVIPGGDHDFKGGPSDARTRALATMTHADHLLRSARRTWDPPLCPHAVRLTDAWAVQYDADGEPTLVRLPGAPCAC